MKREKNGDISTIDAVTNFSRSHVLFVSRYSLLFASHRMYNKRNDIQANSVGNDIFAHIFTVYLAQ